MIRSRDFFCPQATHTISTDKNGSLSDLKTFAAETNKTLVQMEQVHQAKFALFENEITATKKIAGLDGILTTNPNVLLTVRTADCLPILLHHPSGLIGAIHAGRKGTQQHILQKVLTFLKETKKINSNISLWFGPAICETCYQINRTTDTHYNLIAENMSQAYTVFAPEDISLTIEADCTQCLDDEYHSYRVEQEAVQMNHAAISFLK